MREIRKRKIEKLLREKISTMLLKHEIKDPRIDNLATVSEVVVSNDFKDAKIYVSVMGERLIREKTVRALNHAAGFIQKLLGRRISLKNTPRLVFYLDDSLKRGFLIQKKLKGLVF